MELAILCDCHVALLVFNNDKLYQYSSHEMNQIFQKYADFEGNVESLTNNELDGLKPGKASSAHVGVKKRKLQGPLLCKPYDHGYIQGTHELLNSNDVHASTVSMGPYAATINQKSIGHSYLESPTANSNYPVESMVHVPAQNFFMTHSVYPHVMQQTPGGYPLTGVGYNHNNVFNAYQQQNDISHVGATSVFPITSVSSLPTHPGFPVSYGKMPSPYPAVISPSEEKSKFASGTRIMPFPSPDLGEKAKQHQQQLIDRYSVSSNYLNLISPNNGPDKRYSSHTLHVPNPNLVSAPFQVEKSKHDFKSQSIQSVVPENESTARRHSIEYISPTDKVAATTLTMIGRVICLYFCAGM